MKDIIEVAESNNGMIYGKTARDHNINCGSLRFLEKNGKLEKVARGVYLLPDAFEDDLFILQNRFARGVFSLNTALFLLGLSDRTPLKYNMTFPSTYNTTNPKAANVKCSQVNTNIFEIGVIEAKTPFGNTVKIYNAERTLCEILKVRNSVDIQTISTAYKSYVRQKDKDLTLLYSYSKIFKVEKKVSSYMEVLL